MGTTTVPPGGDFLAKSVGPIPTRYFYRFYNPSSDKVR
jgi:hypothetical protein